MKDISSGNVEDRDAKQIFHAIITCYYINANKLLERSIFHTTDSAEKFRKDIFKSIHALANVLFE